MWKRDIITIPAVHNVLHCRQRRTEPRPHSNMYRKCHEVWTCGLLRYASRQTDRHADRTTLHHSRERSNYTPWQRQLQGPLYRMPSYRASVAETVASTVAATVAGIERLQRSFLDGWKDRGSVYNWPSTNLVSSVARTFVKSSDRQKKTLRSHATRLFIGSLKIYRFSRFLHVHW